MLPQLHVPAGKCLCEFVMGQDHVAVILVAVSVTPTLSLDRTISRSYLFTCSAKQPVSLLWSVLGVKLFLGH